MQELRQYIFKGRMIIVTFSFVYNFNLTYLFIIFPHVLYLEWIQSTTKVILCGQALFLVLPTILDLF